MTSQDINTLFRERVQLQSALRKIRAAATNPNLDDTQKIQEIRATLSGVQGLIQG